MALAKTRWLARVQAVVTKIQMRSQIHTNIRKTGHTLEQSENTYVGENWSPIEIYIAKSKLCYP